MKVLQRRRVAIAAILTTTAAGVFGWGLPASADVTDGWHQDLFTCSAAAAPAEDGRLHISYYISDSGGSKTLRFTYAGWDTHPPRQLNALRVDLEVTPNNYVEISPPWGNSSATHDDVSSTFSQSADDIASWPYGNTSPAVKGYWKFTDSDTPMIRVRCYGMGAGNTASDAAHNDADYHRVE